MMSARTVRLGALLSPLCPVLVHGDLGSLPLRCAAWAGCAFLRLATGETAALPCLAMQLPHEGEFGSGLEPGSMTGYSWVRYRIMSLSMCR